MPGPVKFFSRSNGRSGNCWYGKCFATDTQCTNVVPLNHISTLSRTSLDRTHAIEFRFGGFSQNTVNCQHSASFRLNTMQRGYKEKQTTRTRANHGTSPRDKGHISQRIEPSSPPTLSSSLSCRDCHRALASPVRKSTNTPNDTYEGIGQKRSTQNEGQRKKSWTTLRSPHHTYKGSIHL